MDQLEYGKRKMVFLCQLWNVVGYVMMGVSVCILVIHICIYPDYGTVMCCRMKTLNCAGSLKMGQNLFCSVLLKEVYYIYISTLM